MQRTLVRRLRKSEYNLLSDFLNPEVVDIPPFESHQDWLSKVFRELNKNESSRIVFGAFLPENNLYDAFATYKIVGCIFLNRSFYDNTVELKSLITANNSYLSKLLFEKDSDILEKEEVFLDRLKNLIRKNLVEKTIKYCQTREFPRIEMSLLQLEMKDDITLLLELGFLVTSLRDKFGKYVCVLEKNIGDLYQADPFDENKLLRWLIQSIFPNNKISSIRPVNDNKLNADIISITFKIYPSSNRHDKISKKNIYNKFILKGQLLMISDIENDTFSADELLESFDTNSVIKYILSDDIENTIKISLIKNNVFLISFEELYEIAGGAKSSLSTKQNKEDINGILTVLEEDFIKELETKENFEYYLVSGLGSAVEMDEENGFILVVYCPYQDNLLGGKIIGYSEIEKVVPKTFDKAHNSFPEVEFKALTNDDLLNYKKNSTEREEIKVLKCSKLRKLINPMKIEDIPDLESRKALNNELNENLSSSVYLNWNLVDYIRNLSYTQFEHDYLSIPNVLISYARKDNDYVNWVTQLVKQIELSEINVFFDEKLLGGDEFRKFMTNSVKDATHVVLLIDNNYIEKIEQTGTGVHFEWNTLFKYIRSVFPLGPKIIPVLMEEVNSINIPAELSDQKLIIYKNDMNILIKNIIMSIRKQL